MKRQKSEKKFKIILELIKVLLQHFHYNCIKTKYSDKPELVLADTDNLVNKTETENVYERPLQR